MREAGVNFETRRLEGAEFKKELLKKVVEEATELGAAERNDEVVAELADMLDVLDQIKKAFDIDEAVLKKARAVNAEKKGDFCDQLFLEWSDDESASTANERNNGS
jgi:predicted house-cleaning noncanonical NTP pyrophosphatase (MazG superfamily)